MPAWVREGFDEYARRLPRECRLVLTEIALARRPKNSPVARLVEEEGRRMLAAVPGGAHAVALELGGREWSSEDLAQALSRWRSGGIDVSLLVGGPDGLSPECRKRAGESWCLSRLTFPHALVRIIVAEQLYRAYSILQGHPYHRGDDD